MKPIDITCVDNDEIFGYILGNQFKRYNKTKRVCNVQIFEEARLALEHIKVNVPDVILLDLNMPVMNGFDFLDLLYSDIDINLDQTAVYILSSSVSKKDRDLAFQYGIVKDFIEKPLKPDFVQKVINQFI